MCFLLNNNDKSSVHILYMLYDTCQPGFCIFYSHPPSISYYSNIITMSLNSQYLLYIVVSVTFMDYFIVIYLIIFISVLLIESIYLLYITFPILCTAILLYSWINHMRFKIWMIITMSLNSRYCLYMVVSVTFMDYFMIGLY